MRGLIFSNDCLFCPQVIEFLEKEDMGKNKKRGTCPVCGKKDQYLFAKGKCRKCYFEGGGRVMPGWGTADKTKKKSPPVAPASKAAAKTMCLDCGKEPIYSHGKCKACFDRAFANVQDVADRDTAELANSCGDVPGPEMIPVCLHEIGVSFLGGTLHKKIFDKDDFFHDGPVEKAIEINTFCPKCGKRLKVKLETIPIRFKTIFSIEE
jgi:hypothetical protein